MAFNFSEHTSRPYKSNKANRNLGIIFRTSEMFLNLYKLIIRPHVEYAATVCMPLYKKDIRGVTACTPKRMCRELGGRYVFLKTYFTTVKMLYN